MRWNHEHFTGHFNTFIMSLQLTRLTGLDWDDRSRTHGIYRIAGDSNKKWSPNVDKEFGNYDYLLGVDVSIPVSGISMTTESHQQIDHRHPDVRKDLVNWADWVLGVCSLCIAIPYHIQI